MVAKETVKPTKKVKDGAFAQVMQAQRLIRNILMLHKLNST